MIGNLNDNLPNFEESLDFDELTHPNEHEIVFHQQMTRRQMREKIKEQKGQGKSAKHDKDNHQVPCEKKKRQLKRNAIAEGEEKKDRMEM